MSTKGGSEHTFYPHHDDGKGYKLFYSTYHVYVFVKFFHAIYERVLKAKSLTEEKVRLDLSEMPPGEKQAYRVNAAEDYVAERFEYVIRAIFTITNSSGLPGPTPPSSTTLQPAPSTLSNVLDSNKFEDLARILLGKNAFFLFHIDKLLGQALKQLQQMNNDN